MHKVISNIVYIYIYNIYGYRKIIYLKEELVMEKKYELTDIFWDTTLNKKV